MRGGRWLALLVGLLLLLGAPARAEAPIEAALAKIRSRVWAESYQGVVDLLKCRVSQPAQTDAAFQRLMGTFDLDALDSRTMEVLAGVRTNWGWYWRHAIRDVLLTGCGPLLEVRYAGTPTMRLTGPGQVEVTYHRVETRYGPQTAYLFERVRLMTDATPDRHGWHLETLPAHLGGYVALTDLRTYNNDLVLAIGTDRDVQHALGAGWLGNGHTFGFYTRYDARGRQWRPLPGDSTIALRMAFEDAKRLGPGLSAYWHLPEPNQACNLRIWTGPATSRLLYSTPLNLPTGYD